MTARQTPAGSIGIAQEIVGFKELESPAGQVPSDAPMYSPEVRVVNSEHAKQPQSDAGQTFARLWSSHIRTIGDRNAQARARELERG
jgi:hypothetical protein